MTSEPSRRRPVRAIAAVGLAVLAVVAGCTTAGGHGSAAGSSTPTATGTGASRSPAPAAVIKMQVAPGTAKNFVGARNDVSGLACRQAGKAWTASGSVTNSANATASYRIYTAFLTANNDTRGLLQTNVLDVAPGATKKWTGQLAISGTGLRCVLRVERTSGKP